MSPPRTSSLPPATLPAGTAAERAQMTGCPWHDVKAMLRQVGLRPTNAPESVRTAEPVANLVPTRERFARKRPSRADDQYLIHSGLVYTPLLR